MTDFVVGVDVSATNNAAHIVAVVMATVVVVVVVGLEGQDNP